MSKYVKCKTCGYIMEEKDLKDVCPVCGVPKTLFIEHKYNMSDERVKILNLHIHPISVHLPETIAVFAIGLLFLSLFTTGELQHNFMITLQMLSYIFPLTVILAVITGIYDGKVRFKKLSPPHLKIKIYIGSLLSVTSILYVIFLLTSYDSTWGKVVVFLLAFINLACCGVLGKLGGKMMDSYMPGK